MKQHILLAGLIFSVAVGSYGQLGNGSITINTTTLGSQDAPTLTKFNLDFPGGTPKQLVAAIQKSLNKPINVIIQDADANEQLPPLKMSGVTLPDLFRALGDSSIKRVPYVTSTYYGGGLGGLPSQSYQLGTEGYSFKTSGPVTDDSVWYFAVERTGMPPMNPTKTCRYYSLANLIEAGISVEDITTAIQTGWKMMGETSTPDLRFHKETKLLIAVGAPSKLETIDTVLKALQPASAKFETSELLRKALQQPPAKPAPAVVNPSEGKRAKTPEVSEP